MKIKNMRLKFLIYWLRDIGILGFLTFFFFIHFALMPDLDFEKSLAAGFAAISMSAMAVCFVLSTRWRWLEYVTGGLDKSYLAHRFFGVIAFLGMIGHWMFVSDSTSGAIIPALSGAGEGAGELSFNLFLGLIVISFLKVIPYRLWRYAHYLMGPSFALAVFHTFFSNSPFSFGSSMWLFMLFVSVVGLYAWLWKLMSDLYAKSTYQVESITDLGGAARVDFKTLENPIHHKSGQFAFVSFGQKGLREMHPFTIASAPKDNGDFSMIIKNLGDFTNRLNRELTEGTKVRVDGGHGRFLPELGRKRQIWIAGGVGITPFLAALDDRKLMHNREIDLIICVKSRDEIFYQENLDAARKSYPLLNIIACIDNEDDYLDSNIIQKILQRSQGRDASIYFCGPEGLRRHVEQLFAQENIPSGQIHFEHFDMRGAVDVKLSAIEKIAHSLQKRSTWLKRFWGSFKNFNSKAR